MAKAGRNRRRLREMFHNQNGICYICGMPMLLPGPPETSPNTYTATIDHVIPKVAGGKFAGNIKAAHHYCNSARNHSEPKSECIEWMVNKIKQLQMQKHRPFYLPVKTNDKSTA